MGTLNITQYRVGTNRNRSSTGAHRFFLSLTGNSEAGVVTRAIIYFWPTPPANTVGYISSDLLVGLLPDIDFQGWYDILRQEKPVKVYYGENAAEARVWYISVGTTDEGVGEGPRDANA